MKTAVLLVPALLLLQSDACDRRPAPVAATTKHYIERPSHRFENVTSTGSLGVALDTMTGKWCRTWEWEFVGKPESKGLNTLPTCYEIFIEDPSETETAK